MKLERMSILFEKLTGAYYYVDKIFSEDVVIRPVRTDLTEKNVSLNAIESDFMVVTLSVQ
ncbi:MAG: hypothetical protein ACRC92_02320 [Peptostreptococcaceae bacterium]